MHGPHSCCGLYRLLTSEDQWPPEEWEARGPNGAWVAVGIDADGTVTVIFYDHRSVVVEHRTDDWIDNGRKEWFTTTKINPGANQPSIPAIE